MTRHSSHADEWITLAMTKYFPTVYRLAYARTRSRWDAEDVTQEVMLKLVAHSGSIRDEAHLKAWLLQVTAHQSVNLFRSAWRRLTAPLNEAVLESQSAPIHDELDDALQSLSRDLRIIIHLYYYEDMSSAEIAKLLRISPEAARKRLSRARKQLQRALSEEGGERHASKPL